MKMNSNDRAFVMAVFLIVIMTLGGKFLAYDNAASLNCEGEVNNDE